jgi:two-component system, chemotaxis family, protein-glutamate methylesterase/glutaminase
MQGPIRVLVVDDSAIVRKVMTALLEKERDIQVVATAPDPFVGRDKIVEHRPDVLLLDVEMPRMDGITFLRRLMTFHPMPVIMVSSLTTKGGELALEALQAGAVDVVAKPRGAYTLDELGPELIAKIRACRFARVKAPAAAGTGAPASAPQLARATATNKIFAVGASTGGTTAFEHVLRKLPANCPGVVVVQHMPEEFTRAYADRLNTLTPLQVKEAEDGETVTMGKVLIAPGNQHMELTRSGALYRVRLHQGPHVSRHRPSVNVLFDSVAQNAGKNAIGVLMTGMGDDGAAGLKRMRDAGAATIAQDEASSVVYGMPKAAVELGAAERVVALDDLASAMLRFAEETKR